MTEELTTYKPLSEYSDEQIRMYKRTLKCQDASNDEWSMLELMAGTYQLNPFLREIWLIPGVGVMVGHAGFLLIAHRSGNFAGMETQSYNADRTPFNGEGIPAYATCKVWLKGSDHCVSKTVYFSNFYKPAKKEGALSNWDKMPPFMIEKVAEVHALKRAFSITGIYCPEELGYEDISERPSSSYTGSVDGQPVNVEPLKNAATSAKVVYQSTVSPTPSEFKETVPEPTDNTPKCTKCGGELMDKYESDLMQNAWDEHRWGTVPAGLCKNCVNEYWRVNIKDKPKDQPNNNPTTTQEPTGNPEAVKAFVDSIPKIKDDPYGMKPKPEPKKEPVTVTVEGVQYRCVCKKCGAFLEPNQVKARALFVGDNLLCKRCNPEGGINDA